MENKSEIENWNLNMNETNQDIEKIVNKQNFLPHISDYLTNLNRFCQITILIGFIIVIIVNVIYFKTITNLPKINSFSIKRRIKLLCGIYPFVCLMSFISLLIPQIFIICNSLMHISFTIGAYQFYVLCFLYVNGEENYLKEPTEKLLSMRTPPCCCCCLFCKPMAVTKFKINLLRFMILQLPFFQTLIAIVLNLIYYLENDIYSNVKLYFVPFIIISIMIGLWSLNVVVRMIRPFATDENLLKKYLCIQLVVVICKLQYVILDSQLDRIDFNGSYPLTNGVYKQAIINLAILIEILLLSLFAKKSYEKQKS